jgi:hypothetical protein
MKAVDDLTMSLEMKPHQVNIHLWLATAIALSNNTASLENATISLEKALKLFTGEEQKPIMALLGRLKGHDMIDPCCPEVPRSFNDDPIILKSDPIWSCSTFGTRKATGDVEEPVIKVARQATTVKNVNTSKGNTIASRAEPPELFFESDKTQDFVFGKKASSVAAGAEPFKIQPVKSSKAKNGAAKKQPLKLRMPIALKKKAKDEDDDGPPALLQDSDSDQEPNHKDDSDDRPPGLVADSSDEDSPASKKRATAPKKVAEKKVVPQRFEQKTGVFFVVWFSDFLRGKIVVSRKWKMIICLLLWLRMMRTKRMMLWLPSVPAALPSTTGRPSWCRATEKTTRRRARQQ